MVVAERLADVDAVEEARREGGDAPRLLGEEPDRAAAEAVAETLDGDVLGRVAADTVAELQLPPVARLRLLRAAPERQVAQAPLLAREAAPEPDRLPLEVKVLAGQRHDGEARRAVRPGPGRAEVEDLPGVVVVDDAARGDDELVEAGREDVLEDGEVPRELAEGAEGGPRDLLVAARRGSAPPPRAGGGRRRGACRSLASKAKAPPAPRARSYAAATNGISLMTSRLDSGESAAMRTPSRLTRPSGSASGSARARRIPRTCAAPPTQRTRSPASTSRARRTAIARSRRRSAASSDGGKGVEERRDERRRARPRHRVGVGHRLAAERVRAVVAVDEVERRAVLEREARGLGHRLVRLDEEVDGLLAVGPEGDGEEREPQDRLAERLLDRPRQLDRRPPSGAAAKKARRTRTANSTDWWSVGRRKSPSAARTTPVSGSGAGYGGRLTCVRAHTRCGPGGWDGESSPVGGAWTTASSPRTKRTDSRRRATGSPPPCESRFRA